MNFLCIHQAVETWISHFPIFWPWFYFLALNYITCLSQND
jgi:hypothetical protein